MLLPRWLARLNGDRLPTGGLPRLGPGALVSPQPVGLGPLREPVGIFTLQLEHALGMVEERLARAVEERLLTGRVQVAQLALQCLVVQLMRIEAELPRHGSPFHPTLRLAADHAAPGRLAGRPCHDASRAFGRQQRAEPSSQGSRVASKEAEPPDP